MSEWFQIVLAVYLGLALVFGIVNLSRFASAFEKIADDTAEPVDEIAVRRAP